jgi:hypothetical protein
MNTIRIQPVDGRLIFMPDQNFRPVPPEGANVPLNPFYARALADGDVREVKPAIPSPADRTVEEKAKK